MATEVMIDRERFQKAFDKVEAQKNLLTTCSDLWKHLSKHFSSLEESLLEKSKALDLKIETLDSETKKTLQELEEKENSIPKRESEAIARVEEQKAAALAMFEETVSGTPELPEALRSVCRKMDSTSLFKFMVANRKESAALKNELSQALAESVDPLRLVLDAMEDFISQKSGKAGVPDRRWACGMLLQALFPAIESGEKSPPVAGSIAERAAVLAESWKAKMDDKDWGGMGPSEASMFLQMVVGFGLQSKFEEEFLRKLVLGFPSRRDMPKLAAQLGFGEKMKDIIDELVKNGKEIEAVYFATESGLTEQFPPLTLVKTYLKNSRRNATMILKNGHYSGPANDEAGALELNSIKAIIKCVEDHNLESEFTLDTLRKRVTQLEKAKADRKKNAAASSRPHQNKRPRGGSSGGGPPAFRPAKTGRFSNSYSSFGRRGGGPAHQNPAPRFSGPYNYPSQHVYEAPAPPSYASPYGGAPHSQSPAAMPQQYSFPTEDMGVAGARASGSYAAQPSYNAYDYAAAAQPTYQPSYPQ
ncbi:FRIGIDA-like protein 4a [Macadamia integrifolia]|uniref:FRIGIDA-like protein 4a n=1 Tax=Macadamia integrifolia TaxID=60698 RepID=UPI001C4FA02C|nr:FRIGIDA-like protein 4a [Macadamia integrifolia]